MQKFFSSIPSVVNKTCDASLCCRRVFHKNEALIKVSQAQIPPTSKCIFSIMKKNKNTTKNIDVSDKLVMGILQLNRTMNTDNAKDSHD